MISFKKGSALEPQCEGLKYIIHVCNIQGKWGAGFTGAISARWEKPEKAYREWFSEYPGLFKLGKIQCVPVEEDLMVCNMLAQDGFFYQKQQPVSYDALEICLKQVRKLNEGRNWTVHCPRIGCGLGGGKWEVVEELLHDNFDREDIDVFVYDL